MILSRFGVGSSAQFKAAFGRVFHTFGTGEMLMDQNRALQGLFADAGLYSYTCFEQLGMPHAAPLSAALVYGPSSTAARANGAPKHEQLPQTDCDDPEAARQKPDTPPPVEALDRMAAFIVDVFAAAPQ